RLRRRAGRARRRRDNVRVMGGERLWYERDVERVIVTEEQIATRTAELAKQVSADYQGVDRLLLVSVLKGALMFTADFARALGRCGTPVELEFMAISSRSEER